MADHVLETRFWLARPRPVVFAFFADPANLQRVSPPAMGLRLLTPNVKLAAGVVFDLRVRWLGLPLRWRTYVREFDPPYRFVDVQVRGPWARWEHRHRFLDEGGGTWIEDRVTYRLPLGPLGVGLHRAVVRRQIEEAWAYRQARAAELLVGVPP
ncbi:MAG TPA: SRPBCC family protein [Methylomirabilota bacterium]|jgi:ligand-binding SRPBCC domain-containing protein|nr:SRPBCC family protein [Methylomirabilota bacterium]